MLSGKKENEGPFLLNPLWWELFWWTGKVVSVHPRLKTWKKSCLLILPPKPHGPPENSVVFPNETTDCLELSINKDFSVLFYNRGKSWENKYILKITRLYAYSVCMCVCVCVWDSEGERLNFSGDVLEQFIDIEFLYPLDPHFQWSLMYTFVMRQGY